MDSFTPVPDLIVAIETYLQANNDDPKPFVWTVSADAILEKVRRGRVASTTSPAQPETLHNYFDLKKSLG